MKKRVLFLSLISMGLMQAQEYNPSGLQQLRKKFEKQQVDYNEFRQYKADKKGIPVDKLNKNLVGEKGNFLVYIEDLDVDQILATNTDYLYNNTIAGIEVTGEGMQVYQWDGGRAQPDHVEYDGRLINMEDEDVSLSNHSTAIAGIMIGAGVNEEAKGLAPDANVKAYDYISNFYEMTEESEANADYMLSNHSYGYQAGWRYGSYDDVVGESWYWFGYPDVNENESVLYGIYSYLDENYDELAYNAPQHLMIKSAGNDRDAGPTEEVDYAYLDENNEWQVTFGTKPVNCGITGYDCIPYGSVAKNILLVGSINQISNSGRYIGPESVTPSTFSSFGPTDDGRIKPDLVSQGSSVIAPFLDNGYYSNINGTSASAPSVTGISALLQQIYFQLNDAYMDAAQLKALLINTTNETGENPGPDYQYGYGLVDAFQAANLIVNASDNQALILNDNISTEDKTYDLITTGDGPIKATIVWIDPAANADELPFDLNNRTSVLVNDLDMRIIENSSSEEYMPWTLDVENPSDAAVTGDNNLDNVEQIVIENPTSTEYTLTVTHKNELVNDAQNFAIVLSGATLATQGVSDIAQNNLSIYPNPVDDILHFQGLQNLTSAQVQVYSIDGKLVMNEQITDGKLNVSKLEKGSYILLLDSNIQKFTSKFIKN